MKAKQLHKIICYLALGLGINLPTKALSQSSIAAAKKEYSQQAGQKIRTVLEKFCGQFCQLVALDVQVDEKLPEGDDMGFESTSKLAQSTQLVVAKIEGKVQIDERVGTVNQTRLKNILLVQLGALAEEVDLNFIPVKLPRITRYAEGQPGFIFDNFQDGDYAEGEWDDRPQEYSGMALSLRNKLRTKIEKSLQQVISAYCPATCIVERIEIIGGIINLQAAASLPETQQVRDKSGKNIFGVDSIDINVTMDSGIEEARRARIAALMRAKLGFVTPLGVNVNIIDFPPSYAEKVAAERQDVNDPHGLAKLRETLEIFRDLAGTKEIITNTSSDLSKEVDTKDKTNLNSWGTEDQSLTTEELFLLALGLMMAFGLVAYFLMKVKQSKRDTDEMMASMQYDRSGLQPEIAENDSPQEQTEGYVSKAINNDDLYINLKVEELKDELIKLFIEQPKVAKETFSRLIREDGVEDTAKYVHIFGHMVVFELLKDPNLKRDLYELSEYYHNSEFLFTKKEEFEMLQRLKVRCTASEIKVLARRSAEKFDFLLKLDPTQVFALIKEEKTLVQAIVLTQLDRKKRMMVFELFQGASKISLLSELSTAEAIPKEFMFNVAQALQRKVTSRAEFNTESLRTSDILLDLMEKAPLEEQKELMRNLNDKNPETARMMKSKLVTTHMLPYLKSGHLLELILGMERGDL